MKPINPYLFTIFSIIWLGVALFVFISPDIPKGVIVLMFGMWAVVAEAIDTFAGWKE